VVCGEIDEPTSPQRPTMDACCDHRANRRMHQRTRSGVRKGTPIETRVDKATLTGGPDKATLSWWRSPTALASTASSTKTCSTPSGTPYESSQATGGISSLARTAPVGLLEVVILDDDPEQEPIVIHAMPLRAKFHRYLD
jgi:hypothetical protein